MEIKSVQLCLYSLCGVKGPPNIYEKVGIRRKALEGDSKEGCNYQGREWRKRGGQTPEWRRTKIRGKKKKVKEGTRGQ